jgi:hypothetical protein
MIRYLCSHCFSPVFKNESKRIAARPKNGAYEDHDTHTKIYTTGLGLLPLNRYRNTNMRKVVIQ